MFQASGDPWTGPGEKAALEGYQEAGGGIAAIHNATDMRGNFAWWDNLVGALMPGHAATGTSARASPREVIVEDRAHPSTKHLGDTRWMRSDEWYNFNTNVRGNAHVLLAMDETTYAPGGNAQGYDHPISWCKPYDGGRAWVTALGHFGAHYDEPAVPPAHRRRRPVRGRHGARRLRRHDQRHLREGHARRQHERAVRARRRARRPRLLHRAGPRPGPRLQPGRRERQDGAHARRLLRRRGRPARHHRRPGLRDEPVHLRLLRAPVGGQQQPRQLVQPDLPLHRRHGRRHRPRVRRS